MLPCKQSIKEADYLMLIVQGGIGRNIMATAVVRNLKKAYPKKDLVVVAGSPEIFLKNPNIKRVMSLARPGYIYEDYIKSSKTIVINVEPYQSYDYIYRKKHLVECWCDLIGIPCDNIYPEMFFSENEKKMAKLFVDKFDKDMILIQHVGGKNPKDKSEKEKIIAESNMYKRNLPKEVTQAIVDGVISKGYMVGSVQAENQFLPSMAEKITFPLRAIIALIPHVAQVISIDSFLMHGAACFKKETICVWGGTNPKVLGYPNNINITKKACDTPMCHRPNSYLFDIESTGYMWDCPHSDCCMDHSSEEILLALDKMVGNDGMPKKHDGAAFKKSINNKKAGKCDGCS